MATEHVETPTRAEVDDSQARAQAAQATAWRWGEYARTHPEEAGQKWLQLTVARWEDEARRLTDLAYQIARAHYGDD